MTDERTPLRIALVGRGGTGKTTLAGKLAWEYNLWTIKEQVRRAASVLGVNNVSNISDELRLMLQSVALAFQVNEERKGIDNFVSDRSIHDYVAYFKELFLLDGSDAEQAYERLAEQGGNYTHIFLVPAWCDHTPQDGFRFPDSMSTVEKRVEARLARIPGVIVLQGKTIEERFAECVSHIEEEKVSHAPETQ